VEFCQVRLDFLTSLEGPATEGNNAGDCQNEKIILPGNSGSISNDLVICGKIDGQHGKKSEFCGLNSFFFAEFWHFFVFF